MNNFHRYSTGIVLLVSTLFSVLLSIYTITFTVISLFQYNYSLLFFDSLFIWSFLVSLIIRLIVTAMFCIFSYYLLDVCWKRFVLEENYYTASEYTSSIFAEGFINFILQFNKEPESNRYMWWFPSIFFAVASVIGFRLWKWFGLETNIIVPSLELILVVCLVMMTIICYIISYFQDLKRFLKGNLLALLCSLLGLLIFYISAMIAHPPKS